MGAVSSAVVPIARARFGPAQLQFSKRQIAYDLLLYLQSSKMLYAPEEHLVMLGFHREVDYIEIPDHVYYEAHYHTLPTSKQIISLHSRYGCLTAKPPACIKIAAFCEALRIVNTPFIGRLTSRLRNTPGPAASAMLMAVMDNRLFGDAAVQLHFGAGVYDYQARHLYDSANAIVRMSICLKGECTVAVRGFYQLKNFSIGRTFTAAHIAGSVITSRPFVTKHGISYLECPWSKRSISLELRILMTEEEVSMLNESSLTELVGMITAVGNVLHEFDDTLLLPSLTQIINAESSIHDSLLIEPCETATVSS